MEFHLTDHVTLKLETPVFFTVRKVVPQFAVIHKYKKGALKVKILKNHCVVWVLAGNALPLIVFAFPAYGWTEFACRRYSPLHLVTSRSLGEECSLYALCFTHFFVTYALC